MEAYNSLKKNKYSAGKAVVKGILKYCYERRLLCGCTIFYYCRI